MQSKYPKTFGELARDFPELASRFPREADNADRLAARHFSKGGNAASGSCPRAGVSWLKDQRRKTHYIKTVCRTWGCLGCRDRVLARVKGIMTTGLLTSSVSFLITNTLKMGVDGPADVHGVRRMWMHFLQSVRRDLQLKGIEWFKVTELTQAGQVHLHWISLGPLGLDYQCRPKMGHPGLKRCLTKMECLEHRLRRYWLKATGDSYIVDVRKIYSPGVSHYLAKYFLKTADDREKIERLGFKRRYDTSRGWPREEKVRLRGTVEGWLQTGRVGWLRGSRMVMVRDGSPELDLVGPPQVLERIEASRARKVVRLIESLGRG